ncbi:MAG: hypothetical protein IJ438_05760 [Clostridia bacterium]|nr:hypothetical protein [Clostridia bacterium]
MRLYEQPCSAVTVGRRKYKLRLTYDRVLFALDSVQDPLLTDADRLRLMLGLLLKGRVPLSLRRQEQLLQAIMAEINQQSKEHGGPPVMSLTQDAPLIHAAFQQSYGIDLHQVDLPLVTFCELLSGLPESTRFCEVVGIRARPIPPPDKHNSKYIEELLKAKASVALELPPEQREAAFQTGLNRFAQTLIAWAEHFTEGGKSE